MPTVNEALDLARTIHEERRQTMPRPEVTLSPTNTVGMYSSVTVRTAALTNYGESPSPNRLRTSDHVLVVVPSGNVVVLDKENAFALAREIHQRAAEIEENYG